MLLPNTPQQPRCQGALCRALEESVGHTTDSRNQACWAAYESLVALLAARPDVHVRTIREIQEAALPDQAPTLNPDQVRALATGNRAADGVVQPARTWHGSESGDTGRPAADLFDELIRLS